MKNKTKRIIIGVSTIALVILMVFYVDFENIMENLRKISFLGISLFAFSYTLAFIFRAYKLKLVFEGINLDPHYLSIFGAIGTGWAINELTPAKVGDLAKIEYIHQIEEDFSFSKCLCAGIIDRFIDLIILFSITCFTLFYIYINEVSLTGGLNLQFFIAIGVLLIAGALVAAIIIFIKPEWVLNIVSKLPTKIENLLSSFLSKFIEGMHDFRKNKKKIALTLLFNIPTWFFESITLVILFYLAGFEISFLIIILAQIVTFFTKTIPLTPGGWGVSEIAGAILISLFYPSIPIESILSIFILDHIIRVIYVFIYGGISTISINFKFRDIDIDHLEEYEKENKISTQAKTN